MKLKDFERLKKMMERTFSDNDPEALASIRAANRILAAEGLTWDRIFGRTVTVVNEVEEAPSQDIEERPRARREEGTSDAASLIAEAEQAQPRSDFVASVKAQFEEKGWISQRQRDALRNIVDGLGKW